MLAARQTSHAAVQALGPEATGLVKGKIEVRLGSAAGAATWTGRCMRTAVAFLADAGILGPSAACRSAAPGRAACGATALQVALCATPLHLAICRWSILETMLETMLRSSLGRQMNSAACDVAGANRTVTRRQRHEAQRPGKERFIQMLRVRFQV